MAYATYTQLGSSESLGEYGGFRSALKSEIRRTKRGHEIALANKIPGKLVYLNVGFCLKRLFLTIYSFHKLYETMWYEIYSHTFLSSGFNSRSQEISLNGYAVKKQEYIAQH